MTKNQKKQLIKKLETLNGLSFEIRQLKRRLEENNDAVLKNSLEDVEKEYNRYVYAIAQIESPHKREILRLRYIDNATWKAIAYEFYGHEVDFSNSIDRYLRRCYDARNSALEELEKKLK